MVSLIMVDLVRKIIVDCVKFLICNISVGPDPRGRCSGF